MTITKVFLISAAIALVLSLLVAYVFKKKENWLLTFVQNFCGSFFIFSGIVKAVDPLGTAYKMEQYFAEFQDTFAKAGMEGFSKIFPFFSNMSVGFAVFMIVLELVVGVALIIGWKRFLTAIIFFFTVVFFTILTGFTHLTGFVPSQDYVSLEKEGIKKEVLEDEARSLLSEGWIAKDTSAMHFFRFSKWVPFEKSNQKVTDCGCFGDFLVLSPKTSFRKDLVLFIPALILLLGYKKMHQIFKTRGRDIAIILSTIAFTVYCWSNYKWNLPSTDFRPFKKGVNIAKQKAAEVEAAENAPVFYLLSHKTSGEQKRLAMNDYISQYKDFPKETWDIKQERGEPAVPETKISDFEAADVDGNDITENILTDEGYAFMIVSFKLKHETSKETVAYQDTLFTSDTIKVSKDSFYLEPRIVSIEPKTKEIDKYIWSEKIVDDYKKIINPLAASAKNDGIKTYVLTAYASPEKIQSFKESADAGYPFYTADDILLKTIVRSNPGVLLLKNGEILDKWHKSKLPSYDDIKKIYIK